MFDDVRELQQKMNSQDIELSFDLHKTWRGSFYEALQLVRCFDFAPGNPTVAAIFSLLFQQLQLKDSLKRLHSWLYDYIAPFANDDPRNQADQIEKILAIAVYLYVSSQNNFDTNLPEGKLIDYIEYASRQQWLGNPFLAFYCHSLSDELQACQDIGTYFATNFERFLSKKHIPAVCQALLVLGPQLSKVDQERGREMVCRALSGHDVSLNHATWGLAALSHPISIDACRAATEHLTRLIDAQLVKYLSELIRESRLFGLLALMWSGVEQTRMYHYLKAFPESKYSSLVEVDFDSSAGICLSLNAPRLSNELTDSNVDWPSLADVGLALTAMLTAGKHNLVGVAGTEEARLISSLQKAQKLEQKGSVVLSRSENIIGSLLAIAITIVLGLALGLYFLEARFDFALDLSQVSWRNIDVFLWMVVWGDYVLAQVQALRSGDSAIAGMLQIPIARHMASFAKARKLR